MLSPNWSPGPPAPCSGQGSPEKGNRGHTCLQSYSRMRVGTLRVQCAWAWLSFLSLDWWWDPPSFWWPASWSWVRESLVLINCELRNINSMRLKTTAWANHSHTPLEMKKNYYHNPHDIRQSLKKLSSSTCLVRISASCCLGNMYLSLMSPDLLKDVWTLLQKWWYLIAICFVQEVNFNDSAIDIAEKLSSWTVMQKSVIRSGRSKIQLTSLTRFWIGIVSQRAWDISIYSALAVGKAILVLSFLCQIKGQLA